MPLLFTQLCDLLSALENLSQCDPPLLPARLHQRYNETLKSWFTTHRISIDSTDIDAVALLSALFPTKRTDRVYHIQLKRLTRLLKRCLCLGTERMPILDQWQIPGRGNLADCVERVLRQAEFPKPFAKDRVTLEQVDHALARMAGQCRFSARKVRQREVEDDHEVLKLLGNLYQRMQSREAKWFTRMILKDVSCLDFKENAVYYHVDPRLRAAMQMYDNFEAAVTELRDLPASKIFKTGGDDFTQQCATNAHLLSPKIGIKLGPPKWVKAKGGVKHAVSVIDGRTMSVERKHDGEYCQIHIDMAKGEDCVQIFSKSGKDSTEDRRGVHKAIKDGLRIGSDSCGFSRKCIVEGELLIWSEKTESILEFHKIRKHVSRSGSFLGTSLDSQPRPWEHLMIVFYDVLLIDEDSVLHKPHRERRCLLEKLVTSIKGSVELTWQMQVDFSKPDGPRRLKQGLAQAFVQRWEGLVAKPSDEPYFDLGRPIKGRYPSRWIKLKKDCIKGLGDSADFAVLGAGYDVREASRYPDLSLKWTHFYIGCLRNKFTVLQSTAKPHFLVFDKISNCIKKCDLVYLNQHGKFPLRAMEHRSTEVYETYNLDFASGLPKPDVIFRKPFVFDVAGSGFDKAPNHEIFTLRFPRVLKLHRDRDWRQTVGLDELQAMAVEAMTIPRGDLSKEIVAWMSKLDELDQGADGQRHAWDFTEGEDDGLEDFAEERPTKPTNKQSRRARTPVATPIVRMDTGEMQDQERRLSGCEVVDRPVSKHSTASITSDGSLQTPPKSSPVSRPKDAGSKILSPSGLFRKMTVDTADVGKASQLSKKTRPSLLQLKSEPKEAVSSNAAVYKKPLREITNSARPSLRSPIMESTQQMKQPSATDFPLLRKIAIGADEHLRSRNGKRRKITEPPSPVRETTVSESTNAATTQQIIFYDAVSAQTPSLHRQLERDSILPAPPSTTQQTMQDIESLRKRQIILSPCLMDDKHPLKELLAKHSIGSSALPATTFPVSAPPNYGIVFLVEPNDTHLSGKYIWSLVAQLPHWHPRMVRVWDWRIVEAMLKDELRDEGEMNNLVKEAFFAKLSWEPNAGGQGIVKVRWRDGRIARVRKEEFEDKEMADLMATDAT